MHRSRILSMLLLLALIIPLTGTTFLVNTPAATAQELPGLGDPPVPPNETVVIQNGGDFRAAAAPLSVDTSSREAVRSFFNQYYVNAPQPASGWNGDVATCNAGTTSQAYKDAISLRINFFRAMAGVPAGTGVSSVTTAKAQQAALMMRANNDLSHDPPPDWKCYTADGAQGAGSSNLFLYESGWKAIDGYIRDDGPKNNEAGHRAWVLYPRTQFFGIGDIPNGANALWVFDEHAVDPAPATREEFVSWPPPGFVPYPIVYDRWSFQYPGADFANATITMMSNGASIPVEIDTRASRYGSGGMVWRAIGVRFPDPTHPLAEPFAGEQSFTVTISNASINGQSRSFTYDVTVIDPDKAGTDATASLSTTRGIPRSNVVASVSGFGKNTS
ncbi:MAG TPA: CAP domain-containing protein, partial [Thermomicrobiales bacterium]|nr:CAP domain-containing protein [Thermomicrobiales bacterium]